MSSESRDQANGRPQRIRDPERAREAILAAALVEFGARGFAGARTAAIAERAGLSTQLITHHFGGKKGLLDELRRRWQLQNEARTGEPQTFRDSVRGHMASVASNPDWSRLVLWHALEETLGMSERDDFAGRMGAIVDRVRERQRAGEVSEDVDPRFAALLGYLIAFAPLSLPDHLRGLTGVDPTSPEFQQWASSQLAELLAPADRPQRNASRRR